MNVFRDVLACFAVHDFGNFALQPRRCFKRYSPFFTLYEAYYWKKLGKEDFTEGTTGEKAGLNVAIQDYFVDKVAEIKACMRQSGVWSDEWKNVITPEVIRWVIDSLNPIRMGANDAAHEATEEEIKEGVELYLATLDTNTSNAKVIIYNLLSVYSYATAALLY